MDAATEEDILDGCQVASEINKAYFRVALSSPDIPFEAPGIGTLRLLGGRLVVALVRGVCVR